MQEPPRDLADAEPADGPGEPRATLKEGDIKGALAAGGSILGVVVAVWRPGGLGVFYIPYLRMHWPDAYPRPDGVPEWAAVGKWRTEGRVRAWRNITTLLEKLADWGFRCEHLQASSSASPLADDPALGGFIAADQPAPE